MIMTDILRKYWRERLTYCFKAGWNHQREIRPILAIVLIFTFSTVYLNVAWFVWYELPLPAELKPYPDRRLTSVLDRAGSTVDAFYKEINRLYSGRIIFVPDGNLFSKASLLRIGKAYDVRINVDLPKTWTLRNIRDEKIEIVQRESGKTMNTVSLKISHLGLTTNDKQYPYESLYKKFWYRSDFGSESSEIENKWIAHFSLVNVYLIEPPTVKNSIQVYCMYSDNNVYFIPGEFINSL